MFELRQDLYKLIDEQVIDRSYTKNPHDKTEKPGWIFDFRKVMLKPDSLTLLVDSLYEKIKDKDNYQIAGLESAAIPLITALALKAKKNGKQVNSFYITKSSKLIDPESLINGKLSSDPVILVDDLMNSSSSVTKQVSLLEKIGGQVVDVLVVVLFRDPEYYQFLSEKNISVHYVFRKSEFKLSSPDKSKALQSFIGKVWSFSLNSDDKFTMVTWCQDREHLTCLTKKGYLLTLSGIDGQVIYSQKVAGSFYCRRIIFATKDFAYLEKECGGVVVVNFHSKNISVLGDGLVREIRNIIYIDSAETFVGYLGTEGSDSCIAFDRFGQIKARVDLKQKTDNRPIGIDLENVIVPFVNGQIAKIDLASETQVWCCEKTSTDMDFSSHKKFEVCAEISSDGEYVAVANSAGYFFLIGTTDGVILYEGYTDYRETAVRSPINIKPIFAKGFVFFAGLDKRVYCVDIHMQKIVWIRDIPGKVTFPLQLTHQMLWVMTRGGVVSNLDIKTGLVTDSRALTYIPDRNIYEVPNSTTMYYIELDGSGKTIKALVT